MNIYKIIKFIGEKNPKYEMDKLELPVRPVKGEGYVDDDGLKQGKWEGYHNGKLDFIITYKNDIKDGYYESYFDNKVHSKGNFKNNNKDGEWEYYHLYSGQLDYKRNYKNGERID